MHVLDDPTPLLRTLGRAAKPLDSTIALSSIFQSGGRSNVALSVLHAAGELGPPRDLPKIEQLIRAEIPGNLETAIAGSVALLTVER